MAQDKPSIDRDQLAAEIVENARKDRARLEKVANGLANGLQSVVSDNESAEGGDSEMAVAFAEELAKVTDSLTRVNQQLVELVKAEKKKSVLGAGKLPDGVREELYDELQEDLLARSHMADTDEDVN